VNLELNQIEYIKESLSQKTNSEIANNLNCSHYRVKYLMGKYGIKRNMEQLQSLRKILGGRQTGSNNNNWKGGISKDNMRYKRIQIMRYPERVQARSKAYSALRNGSIIKTGCIICGDPKTEMHHQDYSRPLEVIHVCKHHHIILDQYLRRGITFTQIKSQLQITRKAV